MAKIVDLDDLSQSTQGTAGTPDGEVFIDTSTKTIELIIFGTLDDSNPGATSGVTGQAFYSFLKDEWQTDNALNKFKFPLQAFTKNEFIWLNGWSPLNVQTRDLLRDCGWQETVGAEDGDLYAGMISLGNHDAVGDQSYYANVAGAAASTTNFDKTGNVNEPVLIDDASGTDFTGYFKAFLREQGKLYGSYNLLTEQGIAALEATLYRFPLSNTTDNNVSTTDAIIANNPAVTVFTNGTDVITSASHGYSAGDKIRFIVNTGSLPAELDTTTTYFIVNPNAGDFQVSLTAGGSAVDFTDDGTPTDITALSTPFGQHTLDYLTGNHTTVTTWAATTAYVIGDITQFGTGASAGRYFRCTVGGTSGGTVPAGAGAGDGGVTWEVDPGERAIGSTYYHFSRIIDAGSFAEALRGETYEWGQYQLRQASDINDDINGDAFGTVNGNIADELFSFRGDTLVMEEGVFIDNYLSSEVNDLALQPHDLDATPFGEVAFPFTAVITFNFSQNMVDAVDGDTRVVAYFTNNDTGDDDGSDFDTASAIIVQDNVPTNIDFNVTAASLQRSYDYDGNVQRGTGSDSTDVPISLQITGLSDYENQFVEFTLERANTTVNIIASDERNFFNPV